MSRFGIRKKLKKVLADRLAGGSSAPSPSSGAPAPKPPSQPAAARPAPATPRPASPPKPPPAPSLGAAPAGAAKDAVEEKGTTWVQAAGVKVEELVHGSVHRVTIFGSRYALYKTDEGELHATADSCPHAGGPLSEGDLDGFLVTCPFHAWEFDIRDGSCASGQEGEIEVINVRISDSMVLLEVSS